MKHCNLAYYFYSSLVAFALVACATNPTPDRLIEAKEKAKSEDTNVAMIGYYELGEIYASGIESPYTRNIQKDTSLSISFYEKSAALGYPDAYEKIADIHLENNNIEKAQEYIIRASNSGDYSASERLSGAYLTEANEFGFALNKKKGYDYAIFTYGLTNTDIDTIPSSENEKFFRERARYRIITELAKMEYFGTGTAKNKEHGINILINEARSGNYYAMRVLGDYLSGYHPNFRPPLIDDLGLLINIDGLFQENVDSLESEGSLVDGKGAFYWFRKSYSDNPIIYASESKEILDQMKLIDSSETETFIQEMKKVRTNVAE